MSPVRTSIICALAKVICVHAFSGEAVAQPAAHMDPTGNVSPPTVNAYVLAGASDAVYLDDGTDRRSYLASFGLAETRIAEDDAENTQVVFAETPDSLVIAVRGTWDPEDFFTVAQVRDVGVSWAPGIQIHNGFSDAAEGIYSRVAEEIRNATSRGKSVFFTGHSLGGAIVQILALRNALERCPPLIALYGWNIARKHCTPAGVIAFGSPDVGNGDWASRYESYLGTRTALLVNDFDPVPCKPRLWWYDQAGPTWRLGNRFLERGEKTCGVVATEWKYHKLGLYLSHLRSLQSSTVLSRPISNRQISINSGTRGQLEDEILRGVWSDGWSTVVPYEVANSHFAAFYKVETGRLMLKQMDSAGRVGTTVRETTITPGSLLSAARVGMKTYLFTAEPTFSGWMFMTKVQRHEFASDGTLCTSCTTGSFLVPGLYTQADVAVLQNRAHLLLMNRYSGQIGIYAATGSELGKASFGADWSSGWTTSRFFKVGRSTFLFLLKEDTGDVHIHPMTSAGSVGSMVRSYRWSRGWSTVLPYNVVDEDSSFLFLLKASTGDVHVHTMNPDGSVGDMIDTARWTTGWQTAAVVPTNAFSRTLVLIKN